MRVGFFAHRADGIEYEVTVSDDNPDSVIWIRQENNRRIAVIGAGLMGHGIGQSFAQTGDKVVLCDLSGDFPTSH